MTEGSKRSFVAVELTPETREALADLQKKLRGLVPPDSVRWTRPESIHLTLQFLGDVPVARIDRTAAALGRACTGASPFSIELRGIGVFPNPRKPRIVWVGVIDKKGVLARLQPAVEKALARLDYPPETRPFTPHLTIGRASRRARSQDLSQLGATISQQKIGSLGSMWVDRVSLMESQLKSSGAVYRPQALISLEESA